MVLNAATASTVPGGGRPRKLTPELAETICRSIRVGNRIDTAAAAQGITRDTLHAWLTEGARLSGALQGLPGYGRPPGNVTAAQRMLIKFSDMVNRAIAESEENLQARIQMAGAAPTIERRRTRKIIGSEEYVRETLPDGTTLKGTRPVYADEVTETERPPDWKADAWLLERRHTGWVPKQQIEMSGPDGGPVSIEARAADARGRLADLQARQLQALPAAPADPNAPPQPEQPEPGPEGPPPPEEQTA